MEDIKVSHVICNIFYDFVNFLLIMIFPKIWIVNNTCHRSKHAKNFGYRWWLSFIFFLVKVVLLLLCCICQVIFLRLFDDSWVNLSNKWKQRRGLVVGAWTFFFSFGTTWTLYPPYLLIHFYGRCFGLLLGLLHLGIRRVLL